VKDHLRTTLDEIGGEPLEGSGFEDETPDPEFSEPIKDVHNKLAKSANNKLVESGEPC
jgi:hypothetical protein